MAQQTNTTNTQKLLWGLLFVVPVATFGLFGAISELFRENGNPLSGLFGGLGVGAVVMIMCGIGVFGWEWVKKEANKGKILPYILISLVVAIAVSSYFAISLGKPSCDERNTEPNSTCISYADDGFEATNEQRWSKFWSTLPVTLIIAIPIAILVRNKMHENK